LRLDGVAKRYRVGGAWVLRDVRLELAGGQLVRVQGANGSGKSTLLRVLAGVSAPSKGRVTERGTTCYVPERFPPDLPFTARGYLTHLGRVHGLRGGALPRGVDAALGRVGLEPHAHLALAELSKGTAQKVAVAQACLVDTALLVLDEAWTGLDVPSRAVLDEVAVERVAAGGTVIFVDHARDRLAGRDTRRWSVTNGRVYDEESAGASPTVMVIAVAGTPLMPGADLPADLGGAVLDASWDGDVVRLRVRADTSDGVLRELLTRYPRARVRLVAPEESSWAR
jgi:ABC-2 type transport system ATP-binding protein